MSTVAADAANAPAEGKGKGKKKLILIVVAAVLVLALAAVAALFLLKKKAHDGDEADAEDHPAAQTQPLDPKSAPAYVPLDPFTVNLADRDADRYAQIAVTLELAEPKVADAIKAFMPAIRNNILMTLAQKTARELMERDGKERLARDIQRDAARGLGMSVPDDLPAQAADGSPGRTKAGNAPKLPVTAVYFSTFIVQ